MNLWSILRYNSYLKLYFSRFLQGPQTKSGKVGTEQEHLQTSQSNTYYPTPRNKSLKKQDKGRMWIRTLPPWWSESSILTSRVRWRSYGYLHSWPLYWRLPSSPPDAFFIENCTRTQAVRQGNRKLIKQPAMLARRVVSEVDLGNIILAVCAWLGLL